MESVQRQRISFLAAHAILSADLYNCNFATPGRRRTHAVDRAAEIIAGILEMHSHDNESRTTFCESADRKRERDGVVSIRA